MIKFCQPYCKTKQTLGNTTAFKIRIIYLIGLKEIEKNMNMFSLYDSLLALRTLLF